MGIDLTPASGKAFQKHDTTATHSFLRSGAVGAVNTRATRDSAAGGQEGRKEETAGRRRVPAGRQLTAPE